LPGKSMLDQQTLTPAAALADKNTVRRPNETPDYRAARQRLLAEEIELRRHHERVAEMRRALPDGGAVGKTYQFIGENGPTTLEGLFGPHQTLVIYSYMFGPQRQNACPMCTSYMGGFDHKITDISQRVAIAFVARSPIEKLIEAKSARGWTNMPIFSDPEGDYTRDYVHPEGCGLGGSERVYATRWHDPAFLGRGNRARHGRSGPGRTRRAGAGSTVARAGRNARRTRHELVSEAALLRSSGAATAFGLCAGVKSR